MQDQSNSVPASIIKSFPPTDKKGKVCEEFEEVGNEIDVENNHAFAFPPAVLVVQFGFLPILLGQPGSGGSGAALPPFAVSLPEVDTILGDNIAQAREEKDVLADKEDLAVETLGVKALDGDPEE